MTRTMGVDASTLLRHGRNPDGGFGARVGQTSEAEPTALAAIALVGMRGFDEVLEARGLDALRRLSAIESAGGLSLATALAAFRIHRADDDAERTRLALDGVVEQTGLLDDVVALAWAAMAVGDHLPGAP